MDPIRKTLVEIQYFLDHEVRSWIPNEHSNCGPGDCYHKEYEDGLYEMLDTKVDQITKVLVG